MSDSFLIENFGCRAARADGEALGERLRASGLDEGSIRDAGVVIVNTCSVTAEADRAARALIRRAHRLNPTAKIVVTGCYAQRDPEELAAIEGVAAVIGNSHKGLAPEIVLALKGSAQSACGSESRGFVPATALLQGEKKIWADEEFAHSFLAGAQVTVGAQTRPNLKIQEGCRNRCSFCVIPETRGPLRSLGADEVLGQVRGFVAGGGQEMVFSGINLGRYALGEGAAQKGDLATLVRRILAQSTLPRLRLSSIEPMDWDAGLMALLEEFAHSETLSSRPGARLARHVHLPLQSGSDGVLRRMHRRYRPWHFAAKVEELQKAAGAGLCLGTDLMVGFPGETEAEFEESRRFVEQMPFAYLHLFPFSARPGTKAWQWHKEAGVPPKVVDERMQQMRTLAAEKSAQFRRRFVGAELEVITLHSAAQLTAAGWSEALSENFLPVKIAGKIAANQLLRVRVEGFDEEGMLVAGVADTRLARG